MNSTRADADGVAPRADADRVPPLSHRATADPLFRLVAHALETAHGRTPAAVWSAPHAFHLDSPGLVAAAGWPVAAAAAPRADGLVRLSSLSHPAQSCDLPLTGRYPDTPGWAARPYALLRALARAGYGRAGTDLHVQGALTEAAGLRLQEPLDCAVALAVSDVHTPAGGERPAREWLAALLREVAPRDDAALRTAVLFARPATALYAGQGGARRSTPFDPPSSGTRLVLLAVRGSPEDRGDGLALAAECVRRAGALRAWPPGGRPGRSILVLLPRDRSAAVRATVTAEFRDRGRPAPRFVNITVAGAARRED
ncbi:galactokinase [Streptomyces sp. NPDC058662]|uniref:galactokinase n=1 Tax=Streptomyces sp. NPDC058662 TaxID=3346583 RepID=UPI0036672EB8